MDNDHGITGELREWFKDRVFMANGWHEIRDIADRIDAAHQKAEDEWKAKDGQMWLNGYAECRAELMEGNEAIAASLEESGWVKLPVDADGEVIHIGDRMENNERVARIVLTDDSWEPSVYIEKLPNVLHEYFCNEVSHYHKPTVEDVLCELLDKVDDDPAGQAEIIAEYAKRLRLAGDE